MTESERERLFQKLDASVRMPDVEPQGPWSGTLIASLTLSVLGMAFAYSVNLSPKVPEVHEEIDHVLVASATAPSVPAD